jgi:membrane protease YdiL (CAAX protease family)
MLHWFKRHSLLAGLILMFAFTWPVDLAGVAYSRGWTGLRIPEGVSLLIGYGIVIAAIVSTAIVSGKAGVGALLRRFLVWRVGGQWYAAALGLPLVLLLLAVGLNSLLTGTPPDFSRYFAREIFGPGLSPWVLLLPYFLFALLTNGEEIGWRGYTLPRLQKRFSPLVASLILGVVWGLWHLPRYFYLDTTLGGGRGIGEFPVELAKILPHAILYTWIFNRTRGSLLLVSLFHAAWNTFWVLLPMQGAALAEAVIYWLAAAAVVVPAASAWLARRAEPQPAAVM